MQRNLFSLKIIIFEHEFKLRVIFIIIAIQMRSRFAQNLNAFKNAKINQITLI